MISRIKTCTHLAVLVEQVELVPSASRAVCDQELTGAQLHSVLGPDDVGQQNDANQLTVRSELHQRGVVAVLTRDQQTARRSATDASTTTSGCHDRQAARVPVVQLPLGDEDARFVKSDSNDESERPSGAIPASVADVEAAIDVTRRHSRRDLTELVDLDAPHQSRAPRVVDLNEVDPRFSDDEKLVSVDCHAHHLTVDFVRRNNRHV